MCRRLLPCVILTGMALCLASTSWAQVDFSKPADPLGTNPPVFQDLGFEDVVTSFVPADPQNPAAVCLECHDSGVPNRHHLLYGKDLPSPSIVLNPDADGDGTPDTKYSCFSCHNQTVVDGVVKFEVERVCQVCHGTNSPHHRTAAAVNRHCSECHAYVADFDDGHTIPTYDASFVTPYRGLHGEGWHDALHTDPWLESDGSGSVADTDVQLLDTGVPIAFGVPVIRNDPNELRFKPAGFNNDFMIDEPNRGSNAYTVIFQQGPALAVNWQQAGNILTVTVAPSQTALDLVTAINAAVTASSGARVRAGLLHDGENSDPDDPDNDLLEPYEYEPLGGMPLNNRGVGAGSCNYCHDDDGALDVNGDPAPESIVNNHDTHHGIGLPTDSNTISDGAGGTWSRCNVCHDYT